MRVYIAGPITGVFNYRKKFGRAERKLTAMGHIVINPSFLPSGLDDYMRICKAMLDQADAVYFLCDSEKSIGAKEEYIYSKKIGIKILFEETNIAEKMLPFS